MLLLALDTSANLCSAAIYSSKNDRVIATKSEDIGRGHAERLMDLLQQLLNSCRLAYEDLDRIAVTTGPGSFTGIRVGIAAARGLALGLDIPVAGLSVLDAIAFQHRQDHPDGPIIVAVDARRDEIFLQVYNNGSNFGPANVAIANLGANIPPGACKIAGSAANIVVEKTGRTDIHVVSCQSAAEIDAVARLAARKQNWNDKPKPLYLRQADAKPQKKSSVTRKGLAPDQTAGRF